MKAPNMEAIASSLERSLQNCSLTHHQHHRSSGVLGGRREGSSSSDEADADGFPEQNHLKSSDTTLNLYSHLSLPYHWEQCLDLKTGEIYYINCRNGMKSKEDPRRRATQECKGDNYFYSEDDNSYGSEESSSESSPLYPIEGCDRADQKYNKQDHVLVVAGCKSCFMYFMLPKQVDGCPKCGSQLLHFDRFEDGSP